MRLASVLFAAGAPHGEWREWASQAAGGLLRQGESQCAAVWAVVAHDDATVRQLPEAPEAGTVPARVVWWLTSPRPQARVGVDAAAGAADSVRSAWLTLVRSIPVADHASTGRALRTLTDFWIGEDEEWEQFYPYSYPDFEPELNAVAALAQESGWEPQDWPHDALRFLEAGLAPGKPS